MTVSMYQFLFHFFVYRESLRIIALKLANNNFRREKNANQLIIDLCVLVIDIENCVNAIDRFLPPNFEKMNFKVVPDAFYMKIRLIKFSWKIFYF